MSAEPNILDDLIEHATAVKAREASAFSGSNYERSAYRLAERVLEIVTEARALTKFCEESGSEVVFSALNNFTPVTRSKRNGRSKTKKQ